MVLTATSAAAAFAAPSTTTTGASAAATTTPAASMRIGASTASRIATTAASKITITRTTDTAVRIAWPKRTGATSYVVVAAGDIDEIASATTRLTSTTVSALKPTTRYTFIVTPMKGSAALKPMRAVMAHSLTGMPSVLVGEPEVATETVTTETTDAKPTTPVEPAPPIAPAPTLPKPPTPTSPTPPRTITIWECPTGFAEQSDGTCTQTRPYTYHEVMTTQAYTYYEVFVQTNSEWRQQAPHWDGSCHGMNTNGDQCGYWEVSGYNERVKNATPAGFSDDGSQWVRTETVRDAAPDGFGDDGSQWVRTAAKVSREVAA